MHKYLKLRAAEYIFIFLTATIFLLISSTESKAEKNVFIIENVSVEGPVDLKFSRDKYINIGFKKSFNILMSKVLLSKDVDKIKNIKIKNIKNLINNFQIIEENYKNNKYEIVLKVHFSDIKVKKLLEEKNVSFSLPTNIDAIFDNATAFNNGGATLSWNTVNITNAYGAFNEAASFNQNMSGLSIASLQVADNMFNNCGMSTTNYSNLLIGWAAQSTIQPDVTFGASGIKYNVGAAPSRAILIGAPNNWDITDGGQE